MQAPCAVFHWLIAAEDASGFRTTYSWAGSAVVAVACSAGSIAATVADTGTPASRSGHTTTETAP